MGWRPERCHQPQTAATAQVNALVSVTRTGFTPTAGPVVEVGQAIIAGKPRSLDLDVLVDQVILLAVSEGGSRSFRLIYALSPFGDRSAGFAVDRDHSVASGPRAGCPTGGRTAVWNGVERLAG